MTPSVDRMVVASGWKSSDRKDLALAVKVCGAFSTVIAELYLGSEWG